MAVLNFPNNPLNGDQYKENGVTYTYVGTFPNGFWQADNRNVSPAPDPNPTFAGTVTYSSLTGANTTLATLSATGVLGRVDVTSATAPYALKAGDTFSGDVNFVDGAFLGLGINTPQRVLDIAGNAPQIGVFANTGDPAFRMSDGSHILHFYHVHRFRHLIRQLLQQGCLSKTRFPSKHYVYKASG